MSNQNDVLILTTLTDLTKLTAQIDERVLHISSAIEDLKKIIGEHSEDIEIINCRLEEFEAFKKDLERIQTDLKTTTATISSHIEETSKEQKQFSKNLKKIGWTILKYLAYAVIFIGGSWIAAQLGITNLLGM